MNTERPIDIILLPDERLLDECDEQHLRSSGPGGQKRNKTSSAVRLTHRASGLSVTAADDRSQSVNKKRAIRRLRRAMALEWRMRIQPADYAASDDLLRCLAGRRDFNRHDPRYFACLAELLDLLWACDLQVSTAAEHLDVTTAQLVKFITGDDKLLDRLNRLRQSAGLKTLR